MSKIQDALKKIRDTSEEDRAANVSAFSEQPEKALGSDAAAAVITPSDSGDVVDIDWEQMRARGMLAPVDDGNLLARQIRDIKRPLIAHAFGKRATAIKDGNLIMVTSALSGEGKTFITFNLARSMAREQDHTVLLIDADVAKPHTSELFGLQEHRGLLDLLEDPSLQMEAAIVRTDLPGLSILPAGRPRADTTELLAGSRMERLAAKLAAQDPSRIVLFDSPPVLQTSESKVLAGFVGQIAFVICAEKSPQGAVLEALQLLGEEKTVNLILNKATSDTVVGQYGYAGNEYDSSSSYSRQSSTDDQVLMTSV